MTIISNLDPWVEIRDGRADQAGANIYWLYSGIQSKDLKLIATTLKGIIKHEDWRKWKWIGEEFECKSLRECLLQNPPKGIGADIPVLRRLIFDDKGALDALDEALRNEPGRPSELPLSETVYNVHNKERPSGNSIEALLRHLRADDRPIAKELHAKVLAGEMSTHRAAIEAGYRRKLSRKEQILLWLPKLSQADRDEIHAALEELSQYQ